MGYMGPQEMVQSIKCLPDKYEVLCLISRITVLKKNCLGMVKCASNSSDRKVETGRFMEFVDQPNW